jgi:hypothetical protein
MTKRTAISILATVSALISQVSAVAPTPLPTLDMTATNTIIPLQPWDFVHILPALTSSIAGRIGLGGQTVVYAAMLVVILVAIGLRQEGWLIPMALFAIFGGAFYWSGIIPAAYAFYLVDAFVVFTVAGILYSTYTRIRKG